MGQFEASHHFRKNCVMILFPLFQDGYWVECSRSIKLTALLSKSPIKLTALLFIRAVIITGLFCF